MRWLFFFIFNVAILLTLILYAHSAVFLLDQAYNLYDFIWKYYYGHHTQLQIILHIIIIFWDPHDIIHVLFFVKLIEAEFENLRLIKLIELETERERERKQEIGMINEV